MPNRKKVERSANYSYYSDLLWCTVPLIGMSWYYYGARPVLLLLAALLTAYLCDCALAPLHGTGYQSHEPSSECFAALITLLMPASISYPIVISAVIVAVLDHGHLLMTKYANRPLIRRYRRRRRRGRYLVAAGRLFVPHSRHAAAVVRQREHHSRRGHERHSAGWRSAQCQHDEPADRQCLRRHRHQRSAGRDGLFLLVRGHIKLSVVIPFFIFVIGLPWFFPNLNELPTFSLPWEYIRQRFYLEKYVVLSGTALFTGLFLICEPVTMPDRRMSRIIYGAALGIMTYVFRVFSPYECAACCALLIVSSIPEWLDLISHRTERIRFMREEEQRLANSTKPE